MQNCKLQRLPRSLLSLSALQSLDLNNNQLSAFFDASVPRSEVSLAALTYLSLNGNNLTQVPPVLKFLPRLQQLHLHMNRIGDLRELCRKQFARLEVLDVGNNKIREVPVALVHYL